MIDHVTVTPENMDESQSAPQMETYRITTQKTVEVDFPATQIEQLKQQQRADSGEEVVEALTSEKMANSTAPEEKLIGIDTSAENVEDDGDE